MMKAQHSQHTSSRDIVSVCRIFILSMIVKKVKKGGGNKKNSFLCVISIRNKHG